ncbi:MAG: hypothetical protein JRI58_04485 [Deltaproteobacteria bacterium]|nr:hypothetical protein [Deltaproteobacteria bacterium]MBW2073992.1 hypothetical protein [Deltaproteobacteria bacterium]
MLRVHGTKSYDFEPIFLGHRWIENSISEYRKGNSKLASLKGKRVIFPERHFAAALMHLYVGTFSLAEIADMVSATRAELAFLRTQIDFMMLVDALKVSFSRYFRENLILNEYPPVGYASIAAEYAAFEELVRNQIRVPLFRRMKALATSISDKVKFELSVDPYDLESFKKLYSFFVFEESFLPSLSKPYFQHLKRVAKGIVWNRLKEDFNKLDSLLCTDLRRYGVKDELKTLFVSMQLY